MLFPEGARRSVVMFDLPFGTYCTPEEAVATTVKVVQSTGIQLVKLEGHFPEIVKARLPEGHPQVVRGLVEELSARCSAVSGCIYTAQISVVSVITSTVSAGGVQARRSVLPPWVTSSNCHIVCAFR